MGWILRAIVWGLARRFLGLPGMAVMAVLRLPLELFPSINPPHLYIQINYPVSSPEELEERIAKPVEDALASMRGVDEMVTRIQPFGVTVDLSFKYGENMDYASSNARDAIDRMKALARRILAAKLFAKGSHEIVERIEHRAIELQDDQISRAIRDAPNALAFAHVVRYGGAWALADCGFDVRAGE